MSNITVTRGDPRAPEATALLQQSHALMQELFDPEDNHFLEIDALCAPHIHFFVGHTFGKIMGCAALANMGDYGEIKSMFVDPDARGTGLADALMSALIEDAEAQGLPVLKLETGDLLKAAHRLYARQGFMECEPFGDYTANKSSIFMTKTL
ncbi:GNAT family N-acetyltransferase [Cognatishimia maritima]|uniref:Putative acetyltransferase n=1 Tax=Cognatishimia maritima TaxID=870908 RepID=A0A1M5NEG6_9RHOB|nr:GNAT family N-acetyltransferase [Cognatishimia maritima]SHG87579.1 putative acetyltransferase [Cognatishimia maritima]